MDYSVTEYLERWRGAKGRSSAHAGPSLADRLALCEAREPGLTEALMGELGPEDALTLAYEWGFWGRPKQLAVTGSRARIIFDVEGRGGGKTRKATQWVVGRILGGAREVVIVGPTLDDVESFMLGGHKKPIHGENGSGLFDVLPPWVRYHYRKDDGVIEFPGHHCIVHLHSAEVPEYRGPNPDTVWGDELIKWRYGERLLSNLELACRSVGSIEPQILLTTSPKRRKWLRDLVMRPDVETWHGRTDENRGNVHSGWVDGQRARLGGTRQGIEELDGELGIDDGSELFPLATIDAYRVEDHPPLDVAAVAVDPAFSEKEHGDPTGIVAGGRCGSALDGHLFVLGERTFRAPRPEAWGDAAFELLEAVRGSQFVVEDNVLGDQAASTLRAAGWRRGWRPADRRKGGKVVGTDLVHQQTGERIEIHRVTSSRDKGARAAPVSTAYESGRVHHVGVHERLETEMSEWDPSVGKSPNGMDALVHLATHLLSLGEVPRPDARTGFRGLREAVSGGHAPSHAREPSLQEERLASVLRQASRGHWGSRL